MKISDEHEILFVPDVLFGWIKGRKLNIYTDKEGLTAEVVHLRNKVTSLQVDLDNNVAVQNDFARLSQSLQVELEKIRQAEKEVGRWSMYWLNMSYACAWRMNINLGLHVTRNLCDAIFHWCRVLGISKFLLCEDH